MTQQVGEVNAGLLWKQEHLSPLPVPAGEPASDVLGMIWRKNDTYMDVGSISLSAGWVTLYSMTLVIVCTVIYSITQGLYIAALMISMGSTVLMGFLWKGYIKAYRRPLMPPLRFHRQRREVRIVTPEGEEWTVPWERVHAIAPSATMIGQFGAAKMGGLLLWFPYKHQIDEPFHMNKEGWAIMVSPGPGIAAMRQWECIRSFMEIGPEAVPEPTDVRDKSLRDIFVEEFHKARQHHGLLLTLLWDVGIGQLLFNPMGYHWLHKKKFAVIPDLTSPESIAWSQAIPPEQWAKRSPELEAAIAEREKELEFAATSKLSSEAG
ncbi:hypothetical protein [Halopseudomonas formosensis]|uniref:Uncharacterized protein n=1 Tax=Halopseudomonas formosensis TaxID=1002526 RepID=A0ABU5C1A3_9GAMM|nr:hypothetical protein [Halopseudomonas formosensis]MDX9688823.1 hypothetical protein [Halopseudomonas formosensis]